MGFVYYQPSILRMPVGCIGRYRGILVGPNIQPDCRPSQTDKLQKTLDFPKAWTCPSEASASLQEDCFSLCQTKTICVGYLQILYRSLAYEPTKIMVMVVNGTVSAPREYGRADTKYQGTQARRPPTQNPWSAQAARPLPVGSYHTPFGVPLSWG